MARSMNWAQMGAVLNEHWLAVGGILPHVYPDPGKKNWERRSAPPLLLGYTSSGLNSALVMQAVDRLTHDATYICDLCQIPFSASDRKRKPAAGRSAYCPQCGSRGKYRAVKRQVYWHKEKGHTPQRRSKTHPEGPAPSS